jgi:hypothetical protein
MRASEKTEAVELTDWLSTLNSLNAAVAIAGGCRCIARHEAGLHKKRLRCKTSCLPPGLKTIGEYA